MTNLKLSFDIPNIKLDSSSTVPESQAYLKAVSSQCTDSFYSLVLYDRLQMQNIVHIMTELKLIISNNVNNQTK
jgi:hypothetical protein